MKPEGAAGRGPGAKRPAPARTQRSRAARPTRTAGASSTSGHQTTVTARAAILVVAVASVMVAVALPLKIWLGQRGDIASLATQTRQAEVKLQSLNAQDKRWQNPAYVEAQARKRLHYTLPGQTSQVRLGPPKESTQAGANRPDPTAAGPWYAQFWQSLETAGSASARSATTGNVTSTR